MGMAKTPSQDARDEQLTVMITKAEKATVTIFARQMGMSLSSAARYLLREGMKTTQIPIPEDNEE